MKKGNIYIYIYIYLVLAYMDIDIYNQTKITDFFLHQDSDIQLTK